ncbi:MAG: DNA/RNA non-specific endonuclease [Thiomargarita sp.]|nr:DNA/RNA non-specific endonuclease [Thiomargarita sp.]
MELKCILVGVAGVIAGIVIQYIFVTYLWANRHKTYTWIFAFRNHRKLGEPCKTDLVLDRDGYSVGYNYKCRASLWSAYIISEHSVGVDVEREDCFYDDLDIPAKHRVQPNDFKNSGYDKGHLAPSASIDFSRASNRQTFAMSNIVLQHPKLNRQAWGSLEGLIRKWTETKGTLAIITGPLYDENSEEIHNIPIPSSFYKIIYSFKYKRCIGFILPNENVRANQLWTYVMSVSEIEQQTGYNFFDKLSNADKIKDELNTAWWKKN